MGVDVHADHVAPAQGHHVDGVFLPQVQLDQIFAAPLRLHIQLDHGDVFRQGDHIHKAGAEKIFGQTDAGFVLRENDLVGSHPGEDLLVHLVCAFGDDGLDADLLAQRDRHDTGLEIVGHRNDDHIHIGDPQLADHFGVGDIGALTDGKLGSGGIHDPLVRVYGDDFRAVVGQLPGHGDAVPAQAEDGV